MPEFEVTTRKIDDPALRVYARLRAMLAGNYGNQALHVARNVTWRQGETQVHYVGRLRHELYRAGADRAADVLSEGTVV